MYLEISARRSGKTTRLRKALKEYLFDKNNKAIVIGFSHVALMNFVIHDMYKDIEYKDQIYTLYDFQGGLIGIQDKSNYKFFYDEFDWCKPEQRYVDLNGHYCTTPAKKREKKDIKNHKKGIIYDFLLDLLDKNEGMFNKLTANVTLDQIKEFKQVLNPEEFEVEFKAEFK